MRKNSAVFALLTGVFVAACSTDSSFEERADYMAQRKAEAEAYNRAQQEKFQRDSLSAEEEVQRLKKVSLDGEGRVFYKSNDRTGVIRNEAKNYALIMLERDRYYGLSSPRYILDLRTEFLCWVEQGDKACLQFDDIKDPALKAQVKLIQDADKQVHIPG